MDGGQRDPARGGSGVLTTLGAPGAEAGGVVPHNTKIQFDVLFDHWVLRVEVNWSI